MTGARPALGGLVLALAGCGVGSPDGALDPFGGAGSGTGPAQPCVAAIDVAQPVPAAGPGATLHAQARSIEGTDAMTYAWQVQFDGTPISFQRKTDGTAIDVDLPRAGIYRIALDVPRCSSAAAAVNVEMPGAVTQTMRLQIVPPRGAAAPAMEQFRGIKGGANVDLGVISVLSGQVDQVLVVGPAGGVPAYLQFSPSGMPDAIVEAFADASGIAIVQLVPGPYSVLVVPSVDGLAPRRSASWTPGAALQVDEGVAVSGSVVRPDSQGTNLPVPGATVRVVSDGVPSTLSVTGSDGRFALHAAPGGSVTIEVTPPEGLGLPRLSATSTGFGLGAPVEVRYAVNVVGNPVDLAGAVVERMHAAVPGARVTVVGSVPAAGTVTAGAMVPAAGQIQIAAIAGADGALPHTLVPRAPAGTLSAVIEVGPGDLAVVPLDTAGIAFDAPPMQLITTAVTATIAGAVTPVPGALIDLVPTGALALAAAPMRRLSADGTGVIATTLPAGGHYQLRLQDPLGRGGPLVVADRPITAIASSYLLPAAIRIQGSLLRDGTQTLAGASVQLMCNACSGLDAALPLAAVASDAAGRFSLAVPDPGTR